MGSVISILWDKLCEACRWVVSKLEKFVNNLSEKINNLANRANRFSDNLTERLKESIAKAKRAMDEKLEKIADSAALLEKKLSSDVEAIDNETVIQILKAVRWMVKQIQDLLKSISNFVSLIDEVSRVIRNKGVKDGVEEIKNIMSDKDGGDLRRVWFLAQAFSQLLTLYLKKQKDPLEFVFVAVQAYALFVK
ncbi:hypothetical protein TIFTF001_049474 [Ficus carica]|uniref:Uncharacterized protein n=1 Tax=Ficus carica TaxID=3494 RepID=A0AA88CST7_FICCA|nr:hypothetical protein TIFTF001_049473 [Ficus carica]GMN28812.1 hypothetical protein TIFTF001_049474 [Ficus carica]